VPGGSGLGLAPLREGHVVPAREQVLAVPGALAVTDDDQG